MGQARICRLCHGPVGIGNDAGIIASLANPFWEKHRAYGSVTLHFLPVYEDDGCGGQKLICSGSPYRAQYIAGQPRDRRGFAYLSDQEAIWRKAYAMAQEMDRTEREKWADDKKPSEPNA